MKPIEINLKKLNENAKLPVKAHDDDFCYDVWAVSEEEIAPNVWKYSLGFSCEIKENYYPFSINFLSFSETDFIKSIDFSMVIIVLLNCSLISSFAFFCSKVLSNILKLFILSMKFSLRYSM